MLAVNALDRDPMGYTVSLVADSFCSKSRYPIESRKMTLPSWNTPIETPGTPEMFAICVYRGVREVRAAVMFFIVREPPGKSLPGCSSKRDCLIDNDGGSFNLNTRSNAYLEYRSYSARMMGLILKSSPQ
jgi:hypothetical protein